LGDSIIALMFFIQILFSQEPKTFAFLIHQKSAAAVVLALGHGEMKSIFLGPKFKVFGLQMIAAVLLYLSLNP
jgi:hypothetical protein